MVVISPEKPEYIQKSIAKTGAKFSILHDEDYKISDLFDVTFKPTGMLRLMYNTMLGANLKKSHSDDSERLPVPVTFILNKKGVVVWGHFYPDYKKYILFII